MFSILADFTTFVTRTMEELRTRKYSNSRKFPPSF